MAALAEIPATITTAIAVASADKRLGQDRFCGLAFFFLCRYYFNIPRSLSLSHKAKSAFALWLILFLSSTESSEKVFPREET